DLYLTRRVVTASRAGLGASAHRSVPVRLAPSRMTLSFSALRRRRRRTEDAMNRKTTIPSGVARMVATARVGAAGAAPAAGDAAKDAREAQQLVEKAKLTVDNFAVDQAAGGAVRDLIKKAKGVYIAPEVLRGAFIVGASGGSGVLLV